MTITRANVEAILIKRVGTWLTTVSLDGTTVDGTNTDLNDPIAYALTQLSSAPANYALVADSDLSGVAAADYPALLDVAELRVLETVMGNYALNDIRVGPREESYSQLADHLRAIVEAKRLEVKAAYSLAYTEPQAGVIVYGFVEDDD